MKSKKKEQGGLQGMVAGKSAISTVGLGYGLNYRGYSIDELADKSTFEEVAYLLLVGELPTSQQLNQFKHQLNSYRKVNPNLLQILEKIPKDAHPMDVMRCVSSFAGVLEPETQKHQQLEIAIKLISIFGPCLCYWHHFSQNNLRIKTETDPNDSVAVNFLKLLRQSNHVNELDAKVMDVSLILYAEHDFNASTFAARVTTSTKSDIYSAITTGIGTLRGNLHGGANEAAMELLQPLKTIEQAKQLISDYFTNKKLIMGFGHRVYKNGDPRNKIIKNLSKRLSETTYGNKNLFMISEYIEQRMLNEKKMHANLDFFSASAYNQLGIPTGFFTPIFVISRTTGWAAHIFEQRGNNKLIRPISDYVGPSQRAYVVIANRNQAKL